MLSLPDRVVLAITTAMIITAIALGVAADHGHDVVTKTPLCWSQIFLHRACPGCGLTRSFVDIGRGDFSKSAHENPMGPILFLFVSLHAIVRLAKIARPMNLTRFNAATTAGLVAVLIVRTIDFYF